MLNEDNAHYLRFTGPQRLDKAMHSLEGIVRGIAIDGVASNEELLVLAAWLKEHEDYETQHPFNEVLGRLRQMLDDGVLDEEERADILWLCAKFSTENEYFCAITSDMQRLHGIMAGIIADGRVTASELRGLRTWMGEHEHLKTCWPYDELESLITTVLRDGVVDEDEHKILCGFFADFAKLASHGKIKVPQNTEEYSVRGVCVVTPEIEFSNRTFCFTGKSDRLTRKAIERQLKGVGGVFSRNVTKTIDYLIVGGDGNPCWAFACYGRKVESAVRLRKQGHRVLIIHEYDYWDAIEDYEG